MVTSVKAVERQTIHAALAGSRAAAVRALALHPLVDSVTRARRILEHQLDRSPELAEVLVR
jgi:6-phospho-beta-glucosidase